jgi:hypothetical protein
MPDDMREGAAKKGEDTDPKGSGVDKSRFDKVAGIWDQLSSSILVVGLACVGLTLAIANSPNSVEGLKLIVAVAIGILFHFIYSNKVPSD